VPQAFVTLRPGARVSEAQLLVLCAQRLAPYKRPVGVQFLDELPKNPVGKIDKRRLRAMAVEA
ncbi:MAG: long-chain fatty acid--CoA ligase, partial [Microbacterium sp.]|nr:long-chain fatty acid--CoA ligase [Microbacterium sp.]